MNRMLIISAMIIATCAVYGSGRVFYVDPAHGAMSNDGSAQKPWRTIEETLDGPYIESRMVANKPYEPGASLSVKNPGAPVQAGDTLMLREGYHGALIAHEFYNAATITIMAQDGHDVRVSAIRLRSCARWRIQGLRISPSFADAYQKTTLASFEDHSWTGPSRECILERCDGFSIEDASGSSKAWWDGQSSNAVNVSGDRCVIRGCHFKNINFGVSISGDSCLVKNNVIENFAGDGLRGLGDYGVYEDNVVKNCYDVNANHDDGFQSWSVGPDGVGTGVVSGITLRRNTFINYEDPNQPFRGTLQGIGCFDGMFADWVIENNVVVVDHWHGITLLGAQNCRIINNTVVDCNAQRPGPPWIRIAAHKSGTASSGCVVRNNLTTSMNLADEGVVEDHTIIIEAYDDHFVDYAARDLRLREGSTAIDAGAAELAPDDDRAGFPRPAGAAIDIGAYEKGSTASTRPWPRGPARTVRAGSRAIAISLTRPSNRLRIPAFDLLGRLHAPPVRLPVSMVRLQAPGID